MIAVGLREPDLPVDLPLLAGWLRSPDVVRWWGPQEEFLTELPARPPGTHALITADGRPVGYLCWQRPSPDELAAAGLTDLPPDLVDIDILIGERGHRGRGTGPRALALLLARLRGEGVAHAGLGTSVTNRAAIRAFEKAGFKLIGDFEDPEFGPCRYLVARLGETGGPEGPVICTMRSALSDLPPGRDEPMNIREHLAGCAGIWSGTNKLWLSPDAPVRESATTATVEIVGGGACVLIRYDWEEGGKPQDGALLVRLAPEPGPLDMVLIDSFHTAGGFMEFRGEVAGEDQVTALGSYEAPPGPAWGWRIALSAGPDGGFLIRMHNITPDGVEALAVETVYPHRVEG